MYHRVAYYSAAADIPQSIAVTLPEDLGKLGLLCTCIIESVDSVSRDGPDM